ncbi:hypothetical protein L208DRAFT_1495730 [Tricholoma matsutake]|nr:hypothetical protein L208DRAFT_1495730 [Tricholoma matsutake 945]
MANTEFIRTELQAFLRETSLTILHPMDNSHHDNWLTIFVLMVDSVNIFATVLTVNHNKWPIVAHQVRVLGRNLFWRQES